MLGGTLTAVGTYRFNCPFCPTNVGKVDEDGHLYFDPNRVYNGTKGQFVCFRCSERGDYEKLRHYLNMGPIFKSTIDKKLFNFKWEVHEEDTKANMDTINPPSSPVQPGSFEEGYLFSRGFTRSHIERYKLLAGEEYLYDRVVIPAYRDEELLFWQARGIFSDIRPKYISPSSYSKGGTVFNLEQASKFKRIFIKEGPLNAMMGGFDCVALFGKEASPLQMESIICTGVEEVVICLDNDAFKWSLKLARAFKNKKPSLSVRVYIPPFGKDTVDVGFEKFRSLLKERTFPFDDVCSEEKLRIAYSEIGGPQ